MNDIYAGAFDETYGETESEKRERANNGASQAPPIRFKLTPFEQIKISTARDYVVKSIIPRGSLVVFWGPPKCGKSFTCFDIAMHIALGWKYRDQKVRPGPVVYLAVEGGPGFSRRVEAWRRRHLDGHREPVPFYLIDVAVDLIADHAALIASIRAQAVMPTTVFIDTLNRTLIGSESKDEDMARYVRAADAIRRAFSCTVVIVHHCGIVGSRPRGHTSLPGADDAQIAVEKGKNGLITVTVEHMRDGPAGLSFACRLESVDLGLDDDGDPINSCVIVPAELSSAGTSAGIRVTPNQTRFLDILSDAILDAPDEQKTTANIPGGRTAISREWLKRCCVSKGWLEDDGSNKSRAKFSEMLNTLAGKRLIGVTNLYVWSAQ
jgi:hypothetical protein